MKIMVVMNFCALEAGIGLKMQIWTVLHLLEDRDAGTERVKVRFYRSVTKLKRSINKIQMWTSWTIDKCKKSGGIIKQFICNNY